MCVDRKKVDVKTQLTSKRSIIFLIIIKLSDVWIIRGKNKRKEKESPRM